MFDLGSPINICIHTLTGRTIHLYVLDNTLIEEVKQKLQQQNCPPPDQQRLIYNGKQLESGLTLADYNIQDESALHMGSK